MWALLSDWLCPCGLWGGVSSGRRLWGLRHWMETLVLSVRLLATVCLWREIGLRSWEGIFSAAGKRGMFRWMIVGEGFWSMSFDWGSRAKLARTVAFWLEARERNSRERWLFARKAAALTGCGFYSKINTTYVIFGLCAFWRAAFSRCIWAMSSRASSSVISWVPFWSHGRGKY